MPLSEFLRMACGKLESDQQKPTTCPTDLSSIPENDFVELVWENGQIKMQGQSSRAKTPHSSNDFPMQTARIRDKYIGNATSSRIGKVGSVEFLLNDASPAVPSGEMDFSQDDDMATWLNYPIDDNLQQDYCPQLLPEVSGITTNEPSNQNSFASMDKGSSCIQTIGSSHNVSMHNDLRLEHSRGTNLSSSKTSLLSSWSSLPGQTSLPSLGSGMSDIMSYNKSNDGDAVLRDSPHGQPSAGGYLTMKMPKKNITQPCSGSTLSNFSFLSRHTAQVRAGLHNTSGLATSSSSAIEKIGHKEKSRTAIDSYPVESAFLPSSSSRKENDLHNQPSLDSSKVDLKPSSPQPLEQSHPAERSDALCRDDRAKTDASMHQGIGASPSKGVQDGEKTVEPVVASSSVCSGSSADRGSSDQTHNLKRKGCDNEDSEYRSEDVEEESLGVKRAAHARGGTGSKRSRAAEVHNLSERRRRDRINEKMRALQELIPNCNKADKASMLDEAIEYLKTLQLQVQIMSMGAGLCMPPMMFPAGMQHLHAAHMPHFPHMGVGMGMGMGFGMGMLDMNGGSPGCPIFPVPPMQRTHFPSPSVSGPANFQGLAGSNLPIFGHPGQGHPMSVPRAPLVPLPGRPPTSSSVNLGAARMGLHVGVPCTSPSLNSKDAMLDKNTQLKHNTDVSTSMNESSQLHSTNEGFDQSNQSTLLQKSNLVPDDSGKADVKLSNGNAVPSREAGCD